MFEPEHDTIGRQVPALSAALRPATWRDCWRVWRWRNHPSTRAMMRSSDPIGLVEHCRWFRETLRTPARLLCIGEVAGRPVGLVRADFNPAGSSAEVDVVVAPAYRGHGYATLLIDLMVTLATIAGAARLDAVVRAVNYPSLVSFQRAGFRRVRSTQANDSYVRLERRCG